MKIKRVINQSRFSKFMEANDLTLNLTSYVFDCGTHYVKAEIEDFNVEGIGQTETDAVNDLIDFISGAMLSSNDKTLEVPPL